MAGRLIGVARAAYQYPLLIKQLLHTPMVQNPDQQIVYRNLKRLTYADLRDRIGRLANCLKMIGVRPGDTVGVMDWDSNRFLEAFFAVPMMGAILQTVNVRLSPEQITYTINHAGPSVVLVNDEFIELLQGIRPQLTPIPGLSPLRATSSSLASTRSSLQPPLPNTPFRISTRTRRRRRSTRQGPLAFPRACISAIGSLCCIP